MCEALHVNYHRTVNLHIHFFLDSMVIKIMFYYFTYNIVM